MGNNLKSYSGKRSILLKQLALGTAVLANDEVGEFGVRVSDVDRDLQFFFIDKHYATSLHFPRPGTVDPFPSVFGVGIRC